VETLKSVLGLRDVGFKRNFASKEVYISRPERTNELRFSVSLGLQRGFPIPKEDGK